MIKKFDLPLNVIIRTSFDKEEDPDCESDYCSVKVIVNAEEIFSFGDYYHDKGKEKAEAVVDTLRLLYGGEVVNVSEEEVADYQS